ncbi:cytochrome P450 9e2-like [Spodoptera litura]|uniref:unspecific monooxygenase n=1 Tax=Spodoptera litura TaxID=69820 RepID=A0A9J7IZG4_SPOLT|nr:cytochrome P450 9e2-like [Spodoptera litura]
MIIPLIWLAVLIGVAALYFRRVYSSFSRQGIKHFKPVPVFGNLAKMLMRTEHFCDHIVNLYQSFPEERFVGRYEFVKQIIFVRDLELIKKMTVKDFEHFLDHQSILSTSDSYFSRNLFSLQGQEWKDMRSTLSPAFTSSKMRLMLPFMVEVGDQMMQMLHRQIRESKNGSITVDCKDLTTRYANDVIATCAFGLKVDSQTDKTNSFYMLGKESSEFGFRKLMSFLIVSNAPALARLLKLDFLSEACKQGFKKIVLSTMQTREMKNIIRPDMIHLLMEAKKGKLTHDDVKTNDVAAGFATVEESAVGKKSADRVWSDEDLVAQAVLFFIAGFETVSTGMIFLLYELAVNPDVQERLAQEIKEVDAKNGGKFDFNSIQNMVYMDMVVSETLRLWPPAVTLDRICTKDYNMGKPNPKAEKDVILRKGTGVWIPTYAFHRDPQYFPNPDKFDPERFSEENRHTINPFAYMPFGVGPRNCIGSRFALCEIKVMVYQILKEMVLSPSETTCIPAKLSKDTFSMRLEGGHWLKFSPRN